MPVDTQQIMDEAVKLGDLVAQHPAVARYKGKGDTNAAENFTCVQEPAR